MRYILISLLILTTGLSAFIVKDNVSNTRMLEGHALSEQQDFIPMKDIPRFKKGIQEMATATSSINASFKQEKYLSILSNEIDSEGIILFKKPNLLRWEYKTPFEYIIVLNGKEIIVKDQGNVNAFDIGGSQAFKEINTLIINSVQGNVLDEEQFAIDYYEGEALYLTKMIPKEEKMKQFLQGIDIYFDKENFSVSKVKLIEPEGDYTLITFFNKKMNDNIPDENFHIR